MLTERARKFRERWVEAAESERRLTAENARLKDELNACRAQLCECDVQPEEFAALKVCAWRSSFDVQCSA